LLDFSYGFHPSDWHNDEWKIFMSVLTQPGRAWTAFGFEGAMTLPGSPRRHRHLDLSSGFSYTLQC